MNTVICASDVIAPSKIVCVGRNYAAHIAELGNEVPSSMVVFNKPNSALGDTLRARLGEPLHYEGELTFLMRDGALDAVAFGLDLTKRALQTTLKAAGLPWERAKAFDGAALMSKFVPVPGDVRELRLRLLVDGELRQEGAVERMLYPPATILEELAAYTTLVDGDLLMTGTPAGVGEVRAGECFEGQVWAREQMLVSQTWIAQA